MRKRTQLALLVVAAGLAAVALTATPASAATFGTFSNPARITTPLEGSADPSPIQVSGLDGPASDIIVTLNGVSHAKPEDFDILLVSPQGQKVILASDACGASSTSNRSWVFPTFGNADGLSPTGPCLSGVYRDTDYDPNGQADNWPTAPAGPTTRYYEMPGTDPNGTWTLHVLDDKANYAGSILDGWTLSVGTITPDVRLPAVGAFGSADPYPMRTVVSGQNGIVTDVNVLTGNLWHGRLDDLDIYLVGPQGQQAKLMSDSCGDANVAPRNWFFDDEATRPAPDGATSDCRFGEFRPTDNGVNESAPGPAPPGPWPTSLGTFDLTDPNGEWRLYVFDGADGKTGWIADGLSNERSAGFRVITTTRPRAQVAFAEPQVSVTEGEDAQLVLERTAPGQLGAGSVTITATPGTATAGEDYRPVTAQVSFAAGDPRKSVPVETIADELDEGVETLDLTVTQGTGDAQPGAPATANVAIRDRDRAGGGGDAGGELDTIIRKAPKPKTERRRAKLLFAASESDATFECKLDRRPFRACGSPRRLRGLRTGRHVFKVRAVDAAGVADPTPAKRRWRVVAGGDS